jgi:hypothetical protein
MVAIPIAIPIVAGKVAALPIAIAAPIPATEVAAAHATHVAATAAEVAAGNAAAAAHVAEGSAAAAAAHPYAAAAAEATEATASAAHMAAASTTTHVATSAASAPATAGPDGLDQAGSALQIKCRGRTGGELRRRQHGHSARQSGYCHCVPHRKFPFVDLSCHSRCEALNDKASREKCRPPAVVPTGKIARAGRHSRKLWLSTYCRPAAHRLCKFTIR